MKPITFTCAVTLTLSPADISRQILDLSKWPEFHGYGPIPGIKVAVFDVRTPTIVGTRIKVTNSDGSSHVEEITEWEPNRRVQLRMCDFSPPLSRLATKFFETWEFVSQGENTLVTRSFEINAKSVLTKPALWLISIFLKRAIARHLREMQRPSSISEES